MSAEKNKVFVKFSSHSAAPRVLFLFYHSLLVLVGPGGSGWRWWAGVDGGEGGSQGELAVTQFFVHVPPQARHVLLAEAEELPERQTLTVL